MEIHHVIALSFYFQNMKTIEKSRFYQELWLLGNGIKIFNFYKKNANISKIKGNLETNWDISKAPMVRYRSTKFHVSSKSLSRDMDLGKNDPPPPGHTQII